MRDEMKRWDEMSWNKKGRDERRQEEMTWDEMRQEMINWNKRREYEIIGEEMKQEKMKWDNLRWEYEEINKTDERRRDEMNWD